MTKQPFYRKYAKKSEPCPNSDVVHANGFYFGNNAELTASEVRTLCGLLEKL
jgi:dTDP-4-amino-4,6-dideoxygalactose transaminase